MSSDWVVCPFNSSHRLPQSRLPYHITKCRTKYVGPPMEMCPFNATHYVQAGTLRQHYGKCESYFHANRERLEAKYKQN